MSTNNNQYGKEVKPIWKNAAAETAKITKLSGAKLQSMVSNDLSACTALSLSKRGIIKLEDLVGFGDLLHRVDLSENAITRLQGFNSTAGISMLNVSSNELAGDASLEDLRYLTELRTLNIGNNPNIKYIRSHVAKPLKKLQALIAHECGFEKISFLKFIPNLNTLILSKNSISEFSAAEVGTFINLTKLSIGKNMLKVIPDLSASMNLTELRINNNLLTTISDSILSCKKLKTLDISNNLLSDWDDIRKLVALPHLTNLSVKGNNFSPPPESTDDLEVREDKAAETIADVTERRFRRFVLSIFLRVVGAANKTFEQLIVLDTKRVKMKLSPGMSGSFEEDQSNITTTSNSLSSSNSEKSTKVAVTSSSRETGVKTSKKKESTSSTVNESADEEGGEGSPTKVSKKRPLSSSEKNPKDKKSKSSEKASSVEVLDDKNSKKKKKSKEEEGGFLNADEGEGGSLKIPKKEEKAVKAAVAASSSSAMGSGVLAVIVHQKAVKSSSTGKNISSTKVGSEISAKQDSVPSMKADKNQIKNAVTTVVDDVAVSNILAANVCSAVGSGGDSAW